MSFLAGAAAARGLHQQDQRNGSGAARRRNTRLCAVPGTGRGRRPVASVADAMRRSRLSLQHGAATWRRGRPPRPAACLRHCMRRVHGGAGRRRWAVPRAAAVGQEARRRLAAELAPPGRRPAAAAGASGPCWSWWQSPIPSMPAHGRLVAPALSRRADLVASLAGEAKKGGRPGQTRRSLGLRHVNLCGRKDREWFP